MKTRNTRPNRNASRPRKAKGLRSTLSLLLIVAAAAAVCAGSLLPRRSSLVSAAKPAVAQPSAAQQDAEPLSASVLQQIASLADEKATRTQTQQKIDSQLLYAIKMQRGQPIAEGVQTLSVELPTVEGGEVMVDISAEVSDSLLDRLKGAGAEIINAFPEYRSVRATLSLGAVEHIAGFVEVRFIQPAQEAIVWRQEGETEAPAFDPENLSVMRPGFETRAQNVKEMLAQALGDPQLNSYNVGTSGVRKSEADATHNAAAARNTYGFDGTGIKIGVLSDGVRNLAAAQASGDLGPVTVLPGQSGTGAGHCSPTGSCDEGTAMLELVHDLAPGAQLFFATAFGGVANFANNIQALRTAGCDIIIDDVFYFAESPFQDGQAPTVISPNNSGLVAQAVDNVTAAGALYFSSAGNSGNKNDGTSGVWEGDFVNGGAVPAIITRGGTLHQFPADGVTPAQTFNTTSGTGVTSGPFTLNWSDPLGASGNDYDLYILNGTGTTVLASATNVQNGNDDPIEFINATGGAGLRMVIVKFSGADRFLHLSTSRGRLTVNTPGHTSGHSCAADAFGVAATPSSNLAGGPFPGSHSAANSVETFSSDGPRKLFFEADGSEFTPGNVSSTGGISRQKPDITAADQSSVTGTGGFPIIFGGTSAAAPHAGAIAALLKSANPSLTNAQIRTALTSTAIDIEAAGTDRDAGVGIIMADAAMASLGLSSGAANLSTGTAVVDDVGGNGNDFIEPGERATLSVPLNNTGTGAATTVSATLSTSTTGVVITSPATRSYPNVPSGGSSTSATPFEFVLQSSATYGVNINFTLTVTYNSGLTRSFPILVPTGRMALISTTLDTTAPTTPPEATASATGTQTGRLNFRFPIASCASAKANPGANEGGTATRRYDSYTFTNTSASTICVTVHFSHSNTALLHAVAYVPSFVPATPSVGYAGDASGSTTSGAGTSQLFSFNVGPGVSFTIVVSESNQNGGLGVPYNLRVSGLPAQAVPANQPPVNTVPGAQSVPQNGTLTFSTGNGNAISVADPDAGNNALTVDLSVTNGTFTLSGTTGLSFTTGDGTADANMVFSGSATDINNALNGSLYVPTTGYTGPAQLNINTNDNGFTGSGGAQSDSDSVAITVTGPPADMDISKEDSVDPIPVGATTKYTLRVYNRGGNNASNVVVTDAVPANLQVVAASITVDGDFTGSGCSLASNTVTCDLGTMRVFDNTFDGPIKKGKVKIEFDVTATALGTYTNSATVSADNPDPDTSNNTGNQVTTVLGVQSVTVTPGSVVGGANCDKAVVRVTLTTAAPVDTFVDLSDNIAATTNVPGSGSPLSFRIPQGETSATLLVNTTQVASAQSGQVTAVFGTSSANAPLTVRPIGVRWITVSPASVTGGTNTTATVNLDCAPSSPTSVLLKSSKGYAARFLDPSNNMPTNPLTVMMATKQATFTVETYTVASPTGVNLSAEGSDGIQRNTRLDVVP